MKRRNFLSGLMASPLALKARLARFFVQFFGGKRPVELCRAPVFGPLRSERRKFLHKDPLSLLAAGQPSEVAFASRSYYRPVRRAAQCSLPLGHTGPHMLLNTPGSFSPEENGAIRRKIAEVLPGLIAALPRIRVKQISQMIAGRGLTVLTVDAGTALFPGEGSQPACGYQPGSPTVAPCALSPDHKLPHVCRVKITP